MQERVPPPRQVRDHSSHRCVSDAFVTKSEGGYNETELTADYMYVNTRKKQEIDKAPQKV